MKITQDEILNGTVRLLTLNEPYATAMLHNKQETRNRNTNVRGLVCIHSAQKAYPYKKILEISGHAEYDRLARLKFDKTFGNIIAIGRLVGSLNMGDLQDRGVSMCEIEHDCYVKFNRDLWIWVFQDVVAIKPIPFKGKQGWSILNDTQKQLIELS